MLTSASADSRPINATNLESIPRQDQPPHRRIAATDFYRRAIAAWQQGSEAVVHADAEEVHALAEGIAGDDAVAVVDGDGLLAEVHVGVLGEDHRWRS